MNGENNISSEFPFESKFIEVKGSNIHYIDQGEGDVIVFLHGIPTSNYLWRNIIPTLSQHARCIAPDLIGCGKSDKPNISYTIADHIQYMEAFIEQLNLDNVTYVLHGWGSIIGFHIALNNQQQLKALAFLESHVRSTDQWDMLSLPMQQLTGGFKPSDKSRNLIVESNYFMETVFPTGILRQLSEQEQVYYQQPFESVQSRELIWQYLQELPRGQGKTEATNIIEGYTDKLAQCDVPKLMFYALPGFITTISTVTWAKQHLTNLQLVEVSDALHYMQETRPQFIAETLANWYSTI